MKAADRRQSPWGPELPPAQWRELLAEGARRLGLTLEEAAGRRLELYFHELLKWHRRVNLVARAPEPELLETHFLDSLTLLPLLDSPATEAPAASQPLAGDEPPASMTSSLSLLDIGSGAGFPGLVLKCCHPELALTMVEPRQKRVAFLRQVIRQTGLGAASEVVTGRLEPGGGLLADRCWPLITSRALASVADFLALCAPLSPPGGRVICMKGRRAAEEIEQWHRGDLADQYRLQEERRLQLPFSGDARCLLIFEKKQ
ncbi:MAG: 16S rRNA (guanine(527)-N(7))-methyltransferase RsmG [Desulfurivibrio sp.]|nr:16S rRNA (guanine(527)-N(7))-methyltransferase RsmG [Desulfurivibrio sp.]